MSDSFFSFPEPDKTPDDVGISLDDESINHWLQELPLADIERAAPEFLEFLKKINQVKIEPAQRCSILKILLLRSGDISKTLRNKYIRAQLPMNGRANNCYELAIDINKEIVVCEKIAIADLLKSQANEKEQIMTMVSCLYFAAYHSSMILLESYLVYSTTQEDIWLELNQIYEFAEKHSLQDIEITIDSDDETTESINAAYARAILLSMANPFYLMQEEALAVFELLKKISRGIQITTQPIIEKQKASYYIDLKSGQAPCFMTPETLPTGEIRYFIVAKLQNMLAANMSRLDDTIQSLRQKNQNSNKIQSQRDMLTRLHGSWGRSGKRSYDRFDIQGQANMAVGLSASHHNVSGEERFAPELDEILIHTKGVGVNKTSGLQLMPIHHEPWKEEEAEKRIESGIDSFRSSSFDEEDANLDTWEKIYSANAKKDSDEDFNALKKVYSLSPWSIHNKSVGGLSLHSESDQPLSIRVGDVVTFQTDDSSETTWIAGCIRWLRSTSRNTLDTGIMILNYKTKALACRSVKGHGVGSEYLRCLLIGADELDDDLATLLAPAYIYNLSTILAVNTKNKITFVQITEAILNTKSLAQYKFRIVDTPEGEADNIKKIQELM